MLRYHGITEEEITMKIKFFTKITASCKRRLLNMNPDILSICNQYIFHNTISQIVFMFLGCLHVKTLQVNMY